jgi:uncharacterized surface protein with fasciclin (FAS1) repeats
MSRIKSFLAGILTVGVLAAPVAASADSASAPAGNIAVVATKAGTFKTLLAAAKAAGLVGALTGDQKLTVFAPTDAAFAKLPKGTVESLLKPENKAQLAAILKHHIVAGEVPSSAIAGKKLEATSLNGTKLAIDATNGVMVGGAKVIAADVKATNGIIHVVDTVILPPKQ